LFPAPYPNELLYSVLARYKVRCCVLPDKLLLKDVFGSNTIIASPEMPNGICCAVENIRPSTSLTAQDVIANHTLFPLYTAFCQASIKNSVLDQMLSTKNNTYTTSTGLATCFLKPVTYFRYCPACVLEQLDRFGEPFWDRRWFGFYNYCCPIHGIQMTATNMAIHDPSRHSFSPLLEHLVEGQISLKNVSAAPWQEQLASRASMYLISNSRAETFTFPQLTSFYRQLAVDANFDRGQFIKQTEVTQYIKRYWSWGWLQEIGFTQNNFENIVGTLFRKHRKQHMYVMHIVAGLPFFDGNIEAWWNAIVNSSEPRNDVTQKQNNNTCQHSKKVVLAWKTMWIDLLQKYGPKAARYATNESQKLYTAIYRADREWLLQTNQTYAVERISVNKRVSWKKRDNLTCKQLFKILYNTNDLYSPRRSQRWFLQCLPNSATIEHNLHRLPLTNLFLSAYGESYQEYQCRRLTQSTLLFANQDMRPEAWQMYRKARINTQRPISSVTKITCDWCTDWLINNTK
ncbi:MAG: TnsD family transposase, partial [Paraglaciecola sp.]|nr:TnsD family transposase [Paraglaciecola sp.]